MVAKSQANGHPIEFDKELGWIYSDNRQPVDGVYRPCLECGRKTIDVLVKIPADLSHTKKERMEVKKIDACIAPIVKALQEGGIDMRGSCCGHGLMVGGIVLQDGRILSISESRKSIEGNRGSKE